MTVTFNPEVLVAALNGDGEFRLAARYWTARIKLIQGERESVLEIVDGKDRAGLSCGREPRRPQAAFDSASRRPL